MTEQDIKEENEILENSKFGKFIPQLKNENYE